MSKLNKLIIFTTLFYCFSSIATEPALLERTVSKNFQSDFIGENTIETSNGDVIEFGSPITTITVSFAKKSSMRSLLNSASTFFYGNPDKEVYDVKFTSELTVVKCHYKRALEGSVLFGYAKEKLDNCIVEQVFN